jgi:uncharacterized lipoprotein YmbA
MTKRNLLVLVVVILQTACSIGGPSKPSDFYVLTPVPADPVPGAGLTEAPLTVAVGPVSLPDVLDRPQIVTQSDANRIELAEFHRWGGDLGQDIVRVLSQDLIARLDTENVSPYPWQGVEQPVYQVAMRFFRFDGESGKHARLAGIWRLLDGRDGCQLAVHRFDVTKTPAGAGYGALVQALSEGLAGLSQEIATAIAAARPGCQ